MWRKHRVTKFSLWPILGIFLLSTILAGLSIFASPQKVFADTYSPSKKAAAWNAGLALANCSKLVGWDSPQTSAELNSGDLFNFNDTLDTIGPVDNLGGYDKIPGYLVDSSNGKIRCSSNSDLLLLFEVLDVKPFDFLKDNGLYKINDDRTAYDFASTDEAAPGIIRKAVAKKFGFSYSDFMPEDMQYTALKAAFSKRCLANRDSNGTEVKIVKEDGTIETVKYVLKGGKNDVVEVGYSLGASGGTAGEDQKMSCPTIVFYMNKFADANAATIKANITDDNPDNDAAADGGSDGLSDNNPTCESSGNPITWIMCPVFNGVAEFSDWMLRNLVEPLLRVSPVSTDPSNGSFRVWSGFRLYGNIILVISMLVIVFGQAIGGGIIDAYTAKKVMPRILIAAVLVNTSIYIVAILVDLSNILGGGIGQLMTAPFGDAAQFQFSPNATQSIVIAGGGLASIAGFLTAVVFAPGLIGAAASFVGVFILIPAAIGLIGAFVTLVIRQGIILTLILVSPVAFALYCLPNTEKYFKKWWETLFKALLVYPIVIVVFAVADILAITIQEANGFGDDPLLTQAPANVIAALIAFAAMFLPFMMIPWSFKMAGGLIGGLFATISGMGKKGSEFIKGNANDPNSLRNSVRRRMTGETTRARAQFVRSNANAKGGFRKFAGRRMNFGDVLDKEAALNEEAQKRQNRTTGVGDDTYVRARTSLALYKGRDGRDTTNAADAQLDADGKAVRVKDAKGNALRTSLNGQKRYTDYDYDKSTQLYRTLGEMQEAVNYEGKKARSSENAEDFVNNYNEWARQEGLTQEQATGLFTGVGFSRQAKRKEWKHTKQKKNADGTFSTVRPHQSLTEFEETRDAAGTVTGTQKKEGKEGAADAFVDEAFTDMGSWVMSQEGDSTIEELSRVKDAYAGELRTLAAAEAAGPLSATQQAHQQNVRSQLAKIQAMEETWVGDPQKQARMSAAQGVINDEGTPGYTGLSGAPEAVQQAARKMAHRTAVLEVRDEAGNVTGTRNAQVRMQYDANGNTVVYGNEVHGPARP